jgi:hypothetical protein
MPRKTYYISTRHACSPFLEGVARILDFGGTLNKYDLPYVEELRDGRVPKFRHSGPENDAEAIREIWVQVGQYLYDAIGEFEEEGLIPVDQG